MKAWRWWVGAGAACAACCALPLAGGALTWWAGSGALAAMGAAVWACTGEWALVGVLLALGAAGAVWWWRRHRAAASCHCTQACDVSSGGKRACA